MKILKNFKVFKKKDGVALIITLMILALLSIMAVAFAVSMRLEEKISANSMHHMSAKFFARSAMEYAAAALYCDLKNDIATESIYDDVTEIWATAFSDDYPDPKWIGITSHRDWGLAGPPWKEGLIARYAVLIYDCNAMINVNTALDSASYLASVGIDKYYSLDSTDAQNIVAYRYGSDNAAGQSGFDDDGDNELCEVDGIDNDGDWDPSTDDVGTGYPADTNNASEWGWGDGLPSVVHVGPNVYREPNVDEAGEGTDEPDENFIWYPEYDDLDFAFLDSIEEITALGTESYREDLVNGVRYDFTVFSYDRNLAFCSGAGGLDGAPGTFRDNYWRPKVNLNYPLWREYPGAGSQVTLDRVSFRGKINDADDHGGPTLLGMMEKDGTIPSTYQTAVNVQDYIDRDIFPTKKKLGGTDYTGVEGLRITEVFANSDQAWPMRDLNFDAKAPWYPDTFVGRNCISCNSVWKDTDAWSGRTTISIKRSGNYYVWAMVYRDALDRKFNIQTNKGVGQGWSQIFTFGFPNVANPGWQIERSNAVLWLRKGTSEIELAKWWSGPGYTYHKAAIQWIRLSQNGQSDYIEITNFSGNTIDLAKDYDYLSLHSTDTGGATGPPASNVALASLALENLKGVISKIYPGERIVLCQDLDATTQSANIFSQSWDTNYADDWNDLLNFEDTWGDQDRTNNGSVSYSDWSGQILKPAGYCYPRQGRASNGVWWFMDLSGGTASRWGADRIPGTSDDPSPGVLDTGEDFRVYEWELWHRDSDATPDNPGVRQNMGEDPSNTGGGSRDSTGWQGGVYACVHTHGVVEIEENSGEERKIDRLNYDYGSMSDENVGTADFTKPNAGLTTPAGNSNRSWELKNPMLPYDTAGNWAISGIDWGEGGGTPGRENSVAVSLGNSAKGYYIKDGPIGNLKELAEIYRGSGSDKFLDTDIPKLAQYITLENEIILQAEDADSVTAGGWTLLSTDAEVAGYSGLNWWYNTLYQISPSNTPIFACNNGASEGTWAWTNGINGVRLEDGFYYVIFYGKYRDWWIGPDGKDNPDGSGRYYPHMGGGDDAAAIDAEVNNVKIKWPAAGSYVSLNLMPDHSAVWSGFTGAVVEMEPVKVENGVLTVTVQEDVASGYAYFDYIVLIPAGINIPDMPSAFQQDAVPRAGRQHGKINVNTASEEVLACLPGLDAGDAAGIDTARDTTPYTDLQDFENRSGLTFAQFSAVFPYVTVNSDVFEIYVRAQVIKDADKTNSFTAGDEVLGEAKLRAVIDRGTYPFTIKYMKWE